jgi:3-hydroxyisobutyrate dehydrogenase-like beta-hydroxyacid dehydrogenase
MANQIAVAGSMLALAESLVYAKASGLCPEGVLNVISKGAAGSWSLDNYGPRILKEDFEPGFYVEHFLKDLKIAVEESEAYGLDLKGTKLVKDIYARLVELGYGKSGTQVIYKSY